MNAFWHLFRDRSWETLLVTKPVDARNFMSVEDKKALQPTATASTSKGNFNLIRQHVNGIYTATEPEIKHVWRMLIEEMRLMIEPSSAVSVATVMFNQGFRKKLAAQKRDWNIGIILTGGNTTVTRIIEEFGDSQERFKHANEP